LAISNKAVKERAHQYALRDRPRFGAGAESLTTEKNF